MCKITPRMFFVMITRIPEPFLDSNKKPVISKWPRCGRRFKVKQLTSCRRFSKLLIVSLLIKRKSRSRVRRKSWGNVWLLNWVFFTDTLQKWWRRDFFKLADFDQPKHEPASNNCSKMDQVLKNLHSKYFNGQIVLCWVPQGQMGIFYSRSGNWVSESMNTHMTSLIASIGEHTHTHTHTQNEACWKYLKNKKLGKGLKVIKKSESFRVLREISCVDKIFWSSDNENWTSSEDKSFESQPIQQSIYGYVFL